MTQGVAMWLAGQLQLYIQELMFALKGERANFGIKIGVG